MWKKIGMALGGLVVLVAVAAALGLWWLSERTKQSFADDWFEDAIVAFEASDAEAPPRPGGIVFVGSSSIRFWSSLEDDMAGLPVLNRGFGGAQMNHLVHNVDRVVTPYDPRMVVVYAGDNDLQRSSPKTPEVVLDDYRTFVDRVHAKHPDAVVTFLSIKPSKLRWAQWPTMQRANEMIEAYAAGDERLRYIDVSNALLGEEGEPRDDVFMLDGLHLNAKGYAAWTEVVQPILEHDFGELEASAGSPPDAAD